MSICCRAVGCVSASAPGGTTSSTRPGCRIRSSRCAPRRADRLPPSPVERADHRLGGRVPSRSAWVDPAPPNRQIPIWIGGFSEPAFRRRGDARRRVPFAGDIDAALKGKERVRHYAAEAGRSLDGFGWDFTANRKGDPPLAAELAHRRAESGGTHFSVGTMRNGLDSLAAHIDFIADVAGRLAYKADVQLVVNTTSGDIDPVRSPRRSRPGVSTGSVAPTTCSGRRRTRSVGHLGGDGHGHAADLHRLGIRQQPVPFACRVRPGEPVDAAALGGRFQAGLGAGWLEKEIVGSGPEYPDPTAACPALQRGRDDRARTVRDRRCSFAGEFYEIDCPAVPLVEVPPPLAVSVGGPWTIRNVAPLADRVELKFGRSTRGGDLDVAELAAAGRDDLRAMIEQVRRRRRGADRRVCDDRGRRGSRSRSGSHDAGRRPLREFVGEPARVLDNLRSLGELGIDHVTADRPRQRLVATARTLSAAPGQGRGVNSPVRSGGPW